MARLGLYFLLIINKGSSNSKNVGPSVTTLLSANMLWSLFAVSIVTCIVGGKCDCICDHLNNLLRTEVIILRMCELNITCLKMQF